MIILKKKNVVIALFTVFVLLFAFSFKIADKSSLVETAALPVSKRTIVIDAGHGVPDEGGILLH